NRAGCPVVRVSDLRKYERRPQSRFRASRYWQRSLLGPTRTPSGTPALSFASVRGQPRRIVYTICLYMQAARLSPLRSDHLLRTYQAIEVLAHEQAQLDTRVTQGDAALVRVLRHLGGVVVADMRAQRRDQHQGAFQVVLDLLAVGHDPVDAVFREEAAGV